jgi:hypothetical protein
MVLAEKCRTRQFDIGRRRFHYPMEAGEAPNREVDFGLRICLSPENAGIESVVLTEKRFNRLRGVDDEQSPHFYSANAWSKPASATGARTRPTPCRNPSLMRPCTAW